MKGLIKIIIDIGPLAVFFIFYKKSGLIDAIFPLMIATVIAVIISYILEKKIPIMPTLAAGIVLIFGGLTIFFDNKIFIFMKPTIINVLFAIILYVGIILEKPLLKYLLGATLKLKEEGWKILTQRWIAFFIALAILNEIVWRSIGSSIFGYEVSEEIWVSFKVFGILPITFLFTLSQFSLLKKYQIEN